MRIAGSSLEAPALRVAVDALAAQPGGGVSYLREQLQALARRNVSLLVFTNRIAAPFLRSIEGDCSLVVAPVVSLPARFIYLNTAAQRRAQAWGADVLYCPGSTGPLVGSLPYVLCFQNPHLFTPNAPRGARFTGLRALAWLSCVRSTQIMHISATMAADFDQTSALNRPTAVVLSGAGQAIEAVGFPGLSQAPEREAIVVVSNLYGYKRVELVVAAYASDPKLYEHYSLVIAGQEMEPGILRSLAEQTAQLGCSETVKLLGFTSTAELASLYSSAALYVSASAREAFPLTPAEALSCHVPVVLADIPIFRELYGDLATLVDPMDRDALAAAMVASIGHPPSTPALNALRSRFSWEANAEQVEALLRVAALAEPEPWRRSWTAVRYRDLKVLGHTFLGRRHVSV